MKSNRGRHRGRDSKTGAGNGGSLSELPADVQACNGDRLSELPTDVLLNILERVGTLDAVRACILSKKMQMLPTMLSQIVIDLSSDELVGMHTVVDNVTNKILGTRSSQITTIRKLKLNFFLRPSHCLSIGKCVGIAMADRNVDVAEFKIFTPRSGQHCTGAYRLLFAKQFNDFFHDCPDVFAGLTGLHLQYMRFGELDIPNILSCCKRLESLSFFMCDAGIFSVLHVEHARLVELVISYCDFKTVELNSLPKLQRMTFDSWPSRAENSLVLGFVPQLSKLSLTKASFTHNTLQLSQLLANVPTINNLYMEFRCEKIWIRPESPKVLSPVLAKLRCLNLDTLPEECDIAWTIFLLEAAPYLVEFCITVWDHKCRRETQKSYSDKIDVKWEPSDPDFKHQNLAKLTIYGFQSDDNFIGHVRRVMEAAVNIKEVSLHDRKVCQLCAKKFPHVEARPSSYPRTNEEKDLLSKKITDMLAKASPTVIHFCS